jgi:hypothetical protein
MRLHLQSGHPNPRNIQPSCVKFRRLIIRSFKRPVESILRGLEAGFRRLPTGPASRKPRSGAAKKTSSQSYRQECGGGSNSFRLSPGRVDALCMTVATLIRTAHRALNNNSAFPGEPPAMHTLRMNSTYGLGMEDGTRVRAARTGSVPINTRSPQWATVQLPPRHCRVRCSWSCSSGGFN